MRSALVWGIRQRPSGNPVPTFRDNVSVPSSMVKKFKTSVNDYNSTLRHPPEERKYITLSSICEFRQNRRRADHIFPVGLNEITFMCVNVNVKNALVMCQYASCCLADCRTATCLAAMQTSQHAACNTAGAATHTASGRVTECNAGPCGSR
jgi:hypothetical protein